MVLTPDHIQSVDNQWVLSHKALNDLQAALSGYKSSLSAEGHRAIWAVLTTMEAGLHGQLPPSFHLAAIDPGTGKSLAVALFLKAYKDAGFLPASGVLVCVSRLAEIDTYLRAAELSRDEVAVLTSDERLNALGAPVGLHDHAPVMFITQQRLEARGGQATMQDLSAFFYRGVPRALRIWDESMLLGQHKTLGIDDLGALLAPLRTTKPQTAMAVQSLMMEAWQAGPGGVLSIPTSFAAGWGRLKTSEAAEALSVLVGNEVRVVDLQGDLRIAGAARTLPSDFAPALILDASGRVRETYRLWADRLGNLKRLPAAQNDYRNMTLHLWKRASSKRTLSEPTARKEIAKGIAEKIAERPNEDWLIVRYLDADALMEAIRALVGPEIAGRVHDLTWGRHHGTNAYARISNIVIVGHLNYGPHGYEAVAAAAIGDGTAPALSDEERDALQAGEVAHNILQAVCRSSVRSAANGVAGACQVYVCMSPLRDLEALLAECFPNHRKRDWSPSASQELTGRNGQVVRYLSQRFAADRDVVVQKKEVSQALGLKPEALSRCLKSDAVQDALYGLELVVGRNTFERFTTTFEPYPGGGFSVEDL